MFALGKKLIFERFQLQLVEDCLHVFVFSQKGLLPGM